MRRSRIGNQTQTIAYVSETHCLHFLRKTPVRAFQFPRLGVAQTQKNGGFVAKLKENHYFCGENHVVAQQDHLLMNEALQHPIDRLESEIEAQGLVVIDNVTRLPAYGEPYISPHMVIGLNLRGQVKAEYDMRPVVFHPHEISVLYPNHIVLGRESSEDYQAVLVVISSRFFDELRKMASYRNPLVYHNAPAIQLDEQQFEAVQNIINLLRSVSRMQIPARTIMIANLLEVLSLLLTEYRQKTQSVSLQQQSKEKLFSRFYDAIVKHHRDSREVSYYADLLYLSPKYFGSVIKLHVSEYFERIVPRVSTGIRCPDCFAQLVADVLLILHLALLP